MVKYETNQVAICLAVSCVTHSETCSYTYRSSANTNTWKMTFVSLLSPSFHTHTRTHAHTQIQTDRQTDRHTHTHTDTQTHTHSFLYFKLRPKRLKISHTDRVLRHRSENWKQQASCTGNFTSCADRNRFPSTVDSVIGDLSAPTFCRTRIDLHSHQHFLSARRTLRSIWFCPLLVTDSLDEHHSTHC